MRHIQAVKVPCQAAVSRKMTATSVHQRTQLKRKLSSKGLAARLAFRKGNFGFKIRQNSSNFTIGSVNNKHASFSVASGTNEAGWTKVPSQSGFKSSFGYAAFKGWV